MNDPLPTCLTRFRGELERAIARELDAPDRAPRPRQRRGWWLAVVAAGLAAVAAIVVLVVPGRASDRSAWSAHVLRAAEIALPKPESDTILHVSVTQTITPQSLRNMPTAVPVLHAEGWFQQGGRRQAVMRVTVPGSAPIWESDSALYDPSTRRRYLLPPLPAGHPRFTLTRTGGSYEVSVVAPSGRTIRQSVTTEEARALRAGTDEVSWAEWFDEDRARLEPLVGPIARGTPRDSDPQPDNVSLAFVAELHRLLQTGRARVVGRVTVDGRAAIRIILPGASGQPWITYDVAPTTYRPIEFDLIAGDRQARTRLVFHIYRRIPLHGHGDLLRLPGARDVTVDHSAHAYVRHLPPPVFW